MYVIFRWIDNAISIWSNGSFVFSYNRRAPLLFYYFTISTNKNEWVTWTANCVPPGKFKFKRKMEETLFCFIPKRK